MKDKKPIIQIKNLSKSFPGVKVLQDIDFSLYPGEVHVLAGENGAGKSTLIKCMLGIYQWEDGEMLSEGKKLIFSSPADAMEQGIVAVYQELTMISHLDAAQNIFFQREPHVGKSPLIDKRRMYEESRRILSLLHCDFIDLHKPVCQLSLAHQQMIEIAKAISREPKVIIFDEPSSSLSAEEVSFLMEQIQGLKERGIAIVFISHRIHEMRQIGDWITILRDGRTVTTCAMDQISDDELIAQMIGRNLTEETREHRKSEEEKNIVELKEVCDRKGKLHKISLQIKKGEIVGIAGLLGSGRTEIARLIYGVDQIASGKYLFKGEAIGKTNPHKMVSLGMAFVTEDRKGLGLALRAPIHWNIMPGSLDKYFPWGFLSQKKSQKISDDYIRELKIACPDSQKIVEELSGGNQQKVVLAKWFAADSDFLIFDEPTRGIDIGARQEIYQILNDLKKKGKSVLLISSDMKELMDLSDRIYGLCDGSITGELAREEFSKEKIAKMIFQKTKENDSSRDYSQRNLLKGLLSLPPAAYMGLILLLLFAIGSEHFLSISNLSNILSQSAALLILACGQAMVVLIQGTDLSLGSIVSLVGVFYFFLLNMGLPMGIAILLCLLCGVFCGLCNGMVVAKGKIPIFIVTLGSQNIFKSIALLLCGSQTLYYSSDSFRIMAKGSCFALTYITWIALLVFLLTFLFFEYSSLEARLRALGGNPQAIPYSGGSLIKEKIKVFIFAGLMASISGLVLCCRIESGNPNAGTGMEFNSIAAVLLGGISMREGKGEICGIIYGVLMIQILKSGLTQIGMDSFYQNASIGTLVLMAIIIDAVLKKRKEKGGME